MGLDIGHPTIADTAAPILQTVTYPSLGSSGW